MPRTEAEVDQLAENAAGRVVAHLEGERLISRFIDSYVMGFDRPQLKVPADKFLERANALARQALVLLGVLVEEKCGGQLDRFRLGPLRLRDHAAASRFSRSFWPALGTRLKGGAAPPEELARQAEEYRDAAARLELFAGRIAPLLDPQPTMKEKAEHAGRKFYEALDQVAAQVATRLAQR